MATVIGAAWWVQRTLDAGRSLYQGFLEALVAAFLVAVVLGNFERRWGGAKQKRAEVSPGGGASEEFEEATEETVETLNPKMNALFNDLNGRVGELEKEALGASTPQTDPER